MSFCNSFLCYYVLMNLNSVIIKNILSFYKGWNINAANVLFNKSENQIVNYKAINPQTSSNCGENFSGAQILINSCLNSFFFKQKFCWKEGIGLMNIFNFRFFDESTKNSPRSRFGLMKFCQISWNYTNKFVNFSLT